MRSADLILILPLTVIVVSLALQGYALYDLFYRNWRVDDNSRMLWAVFIIIGSFFGATAYLMMGRAKR